MKKIILITAVLLTLPAIMAPVLADQMKDGQASSRKRAQSLVDQGLALSNNSLEEAQFYRRAIEIDPTYASAHFNLGFVHHSRGELEKAMEAYSKCLRHDPRRHDAHRNLAICLLAVRRDTSLYEVRQHLNLAIEIQETLPTEKRDGDLGEQRVQLLELETRINELFKPSVRDYYPSEQIVRVLSRRITRGGQNIYEGPRQTLLFFNTGSAELTKRNERQLQALAHALQSPGLIANYFVIEGHADGRGSAASNLALSKRRAETVRDWLIRYGNIKPGRLSMAFYGEDHPIFPNNSPEHYRYNRRIEIVRRDIQ